MRDGGSKPFKRATVFRTCKYYHCTGPAHTPFLWRTAAFVVGKLVDGKYGNLINSSSAQYNVITVAALIVLVKPGAPQFNTVYTDEGEKLSYR